METVMEVIGYNGDKVTIAGSQAGTEGIWLAMDVEGLVDPEVDIITKAVGARPGAKLISHRIVERTLVFKVTIENDENDSWASRDDRWRSLWAYDKPSEIKVTTTQWGTRTLTVYLNEIEVDTEYDPFVNGSTDVTMTVTAYDPFWYAPELVQEKTPDASGKYTFTFSTYLNPTTNPVFPKYVMSGPGTYNVRANYGAGTVVRIPVTLLEGEEVVVNTDPGSRQIVEANGVPVWSRMNGARFRDPIPPKYNQRQMILTSTGAEGKAVQLRITQPYNRPWGNN